jgi:hypothetical protein
VKTLIFILILCSFQAVCEVTFENCEPKTCKILTKTIPKGIPIYIGNLYSGKDLKIDMSDVEKIIQSGEKFKVCLGASRIYVIKYKCFDGQCLFVSSGSYKSTRTVFDECL